MNRRDFCRPDEDSIATLQDRLKPVPIAEVRRERTTSDEVIGYAVCMSMIIWLSKVRPSFLPRSFLREKQ